jgi:thiol-disulfide isomerase/thioredoxin
MLLSILIAVQLSLVSTKVIADDHATAGPSAENLLNRSFQLYENGNYGDALILLDDGVLRYPDKRIWFLNQKYLVLLKWDDNESLIDISIERAQFFNESPKKSREVVLAYLRDSDNEKALDWLQQTLERGYQDHADLVGNEAFDPLRGSVQFETIVKSIEDRIGIKKKAIPFEGKLLDGSEVSLDSYLGKVVLIDFWAVYCRPCLVEINSMLEYYPDMRPDGFEIVGVNLDEDRDDVTSYVDKKNIPWPVIYSGKAWEDDIRVAYNLANIPSYWLIDRKGVLRFVGLKGKSLEEKIRFLLEE